jgi:hypothetical protein
MLALFHNNGAIYDSNGVIAFQGQILCTYDGGSWWGWFTTFSVEESAEKPYQFTLNASFTVERELHRVKSMYVPPATARGPSSTGPTGNGTTAANGAAATAGTPGASSQQTGPAKTDNVAWRESPEGQQALAEAAAAAAGATRTPARRRR